MKSYTPFRESPIAAGSPARSSPQAPCSQSPLMLAPWPLLGSRAGRDGCGHPVFLGSRAGGRFQGHCGKAGQARLCSTACQNRSGVQLGGWGTGSSHPCCHLHGGIWSGGLCKSPLGNAEMPPNSRELLEGLNGADTQTAPECPFGQPRELTPTTASSW